MQGINTRGVTHDSLGHDVATPRWFPPPSSQSSSCDLLGKVPAPPFSPATPQDLTHPCWSFPESGDMLGFGERGKDQHSMPCCPHGSCMLCLTMGTKPSSEIASAWGTHTWAATHPAPDLAEVQSDQLRSLDRLVGGHTKVRFPIALHSCVDKK